MSKFRSGPIWEIDKEKLQDIVNESNSIAKILKKLGYIKMATHYYKSLKSRCKKDNINYSHIQLGKLCNKNKKFPSKAIPLEEVMVENSTYSRGSLKARLLKDGILENKCSNCNIEPEWDGKKLVMILDHINGISNDHRLENLRLLCPNCNSQTETFAGKKPRNKCQLCKVSIHRKSTFCKKCASKTYSYRTRLHERPLREILINDIKNLPMVKVGKKYGVSDNTIRDWARDYEIELEKKKFSVPEKTCPICKKPFKTSVRDQIFCSVECLKINKDNRIPKDDLINIVKKHTGTLKAAQEIGIGKTTLREWLISYDLPTTCKEMKNIL